MCNNIFTLWHISCKDLWRMFDLAQVYAKMIWCIFFYSYFNQISKHVKTLLPGSFKSLKSLEIFNVYDNILYTYWK